MKIQIESVNMTYENGEVVIVKVDHTVSGTVLRSGRGRLELTFDEYQGNESVPKLEEMIRDAIKDEIEGEPEDAE